MKKLKVTRDYVLNEILKDYNDKYNLKDVWEISDDEIIRREAIIFKVKSQYHKKHIAIKIYTNHQAIVRKQYQAFKHYFENMDDIYTVPEPYGYLLESGALVTEWIDYKGTDKQLWGFNMDFDARSEFVANIGKWLRKFHACSEITIQEYSSKSVIRKIDNMMAKVSGFNKLYISLASFKRAYNKIIEYNNKFEGLELEYIDIHGDFTPSNLLAGDKYVGIDFNQNIEAPAIFDIARFLIYLDVYRKFLTKGSSLSRYGCNERDFKAFISGYGEYDKNVTPEFFYYIQLCEVLRRFTSLCIGRKPKGIKRIYRLVELYRVGRMAKYLLIALDKFKNK